MPSLLFRTLLCLLSLALPACLQATAAHCPRPFSETVLRDSLADGSTAGDTEDEDATTAAIGSNSDTEKIIDPEPLVPDTTLIPILPLTPGGDYSVGLSESAASVSNSGAAVYSLSIKVPDGGTLTPQIALAYNSQSAGYGLAGYGFNITGISAITRGGKDLFHDGRLAGVTYTASDNFFLDGKRLILKSGVSGQNGAIYTVEGDPFTKITVHGDYNSSTATTWFEVTASNGMTYEYGHSACSRVAYRNKSGLPRIASWYINKATDKYSNYISYQYTQSDLCIRPTAITYGTNAARSRGLTNSITFTYQSLGETARPFTIEDQQGKTAYCLSAITTTSNNAVYRRYALTYDSSSDQSTGKWTRLVAVQEENGKGEKLPPTRFTWQHLPSPAVRSSQLDVATKDADSSVEETDRLFFSADLNGDGISDIIRVSPVKITTTWNGGGETSHHTYVYVSRSKTEASGGVTFEPPLTYTLPPNISMDVVKSLPGGPTVMDFDGDGYNDLVFPYQNADTGHWSQAVFHIIRGSDVAAGRTGTSAFAIDLQSTDRAPLFAVLDADGDGKDDVVCVEQRGKDGYYPCAVVRHTGGSSLSHTDIRLTLPQGASGDIEKVFTGDYNNDGLADLMLLYDGGYKIYFNNGGTAVASVFSESNTKSGTDFGNCWRVRQGDFDGDGLTDFVYYKTGESCLRIARNNGDGTFTLTKTADIGISDHTSTKDNSRFSLMTCDIDHDGRTDVMVCKAGYEYRGFPKFRYDYTNTQVRWLCSTGSDLKQAFSYTKNREDDAQEGTIFLGDFDGDGFPELANYGSDLNSTNGSFAEKINIYQSGYSLPAAGKILTITDGMGNNSTIQYASATNPSVYKKSIKGAYPLNTYTLPLSVVARMTSDNGVAGSQTTKYSYEDLRLHIGGRGLLGFNTVTAENTTLGTKESTSVTRWDKNLWIPVETKTINTIGNSTSTVLSTYSISTLDKNYFAYVSRKDVTDLDGNTATTLTNYDTAKGVITDETVLNDSDNMYKKVSYSGYQNKAGVWLPTVLTMTQKHADDASPHTTVTTYRYDDKGNVTSSTRNSGTDMALTTTSSFDAYGNVLSSCTTGSGVKTVTRYNEYDSSGRFVTKSYTLPASAVSTFTYDQWGNRLTASDATDPSGILTATHTYDGWGRRLATLHADGTQTTHETGWGNNSYKKYYDKETTTGKPSVTTWYDKGGNEVVKETVGAKGVNIFASTSYNSKGLPIRIVNKTGKLTATQNLTYDDRGRIVREELSTGKTTSYSYGNRSVTTAIGDRVYTKTFDAWGNLVKATDPVSEVGYTYSSIGKPSSVESQGSTITMTYDVAGNQLSLSDPDAGTSHYTYAADGTLLTQTDGRGIKTINSYDDLGRLISTQIGQETIAYTYGTSGNEKLRLIKQTTGNNSIEYAHDKFGRIVKEKRNVAGNGTYNFSYTYNNKGQLSKTIYPGGVEESYSYDANGYKTQASLGDKVIYHMEGFDGLTGSASFMGKLTATQTRDARGYESNRSITSGALSLENFDESYDGATGNLLSRQRNLGAAETFGYDSLDRLVSTESSAAGAMEISYAPNGNILSKTGVGSFSYDERIRPHAVVEVENENGAIPGETLTASFNDFGKVEQIVDDGKNLTMDFSYGPDRQRWHSVLMKDGADLRSTVYAGDYEKVTENGTTREFYYLDGNTIAVRENGVLTPYLAFTDNLGSILAVMDENGKKVFSASYDAWGRQTITLNTIGLHRGYTGHEMLSELDIINMNGRLYDPVLGRFFSPDPYVQMPDNSQNFNRYSYCLNNPLKYTDPSGELFGIDDAVIAFAAFNIGTSMMQAAFDGKSIWKAGALSLLSSAASYGVGAIFGNTGSIGHELMRAGAHGLAGGVIGALDGGNFFNFFISGAAASGMGSFAQAAGINEGLMIASTTTMGGAMAWMTGGDFLQGAMQGLTIGLYNHAMHDGSDGIRYYRDEKGNICGEISEIVVKPSMISDKFIAWIDYGVSAIDYFGESLKENGGNSTIASNRKIYWHNENQHGFYGNQYVSVYKLTRMGNKITKVASPIGVATSIHEIYKGYKLDGGNFQSIGYNTSRATASVIGGWAGGWAGVKTGGILGAYIGGPPGAVVGGFVFGVVCAFGGSTLGELSVDRIMNY